MTLDITSTWLMLGLIIFCALCMAAIFVAHAINNEWRKADEPFFRTADGGLLTADARTALRKASNIGVSACTGNCSQGRHCTCCPPKRKGTT